MPTLLRASTTSSSMAAKTRAPRLPLPTELDPGGLYLFMKRLETCKLEWSTTTTTTTTTTSS